MERRNQAHIFGGSFFIFLAAGRKKGLLIFLLGGRKSLSQTLALNWFHLVLLTCTFAYRQMTMVQLVIMFNRHFFIGLKLKYSLSGDLLALKMAVCFTNWQPHSNQLAYHQLVRWGPPYQ